MLVLLLYFLTLVCYCNCLEHPCLTEARTRTNGGGFSVDLIHRYTHPKSPHYDPSMSPTQVFRRLITSSARRHRQIRWQLHHFAAATSTLTPNGGDYLMEIEVGTPPIRLQAVAATGTDLTWFQCNHQNTTTFDPESSKTYWNLPCDAPACTDLGTAAYCDQQQNLCTYRYAYGTGTAVTEGIMGNDTISFPAGCLKPAVFPSIAFGCGLHQYGPFDSDSAGVVGLGHGPASLVSQLGPSVSNKFAYCLTCVTSHSVSTLRFGDYSDSASASVATQHLTTPLVTPNNNPSSSYYYLGLKGVSIGETFINTDKNIMVDTGTTLTYLDPTIFNTLVAMVNEAIGASPVSDNPLVDPVVCYDTTAAALTPPDIVLHFVGGDLVLRADTVFFTIDRYLCLSITRSSQDGDPMVLGNMAQVNLEVEFDLLAKTISFAYKDCSHDN